MNRILIAVSVGVLIGASIVFAASPNMTPGKWETTMAMEMPGMPMSMPPVTTSQCITKKDLEENKRFVPNAGEKGECEVTDVKTKGNTVTWNIRCKDGNSGSGEMTYKGASYSGTMTMKMKKENMEMKYKIKGRRIGDC